MFRSLSKCLIVCSLFIFLSPVLQAQQSSGGAGIGITPANIEEMMDPGAAKQFSIEVKNLSNQDQTYYLYKNDIVDATDSGVPIFADAALPKTEFDLSEWVSLDQNTIDVLAGSSVTITFTVTVPQSASPGTHFGGIFISMQPPKMRQTGAAVGYEVGNIISIRVAGEVLEKASIRQFSTDNYIYGSPDVTFNIKIENSGTTLIRPIGIFQITNMFGREVSSDLRFNDSQAGVFPGNTRDYITEWKGKPPGFGRYQARVSVQYGETGAKQTITSTVTFWILPMNIILPSLGILAALFLISYVGVRLYVQRQLAFYTATAGNRRLVQRRKQSHSSALLMVLTVMIMVTSLFLIILLALFAQ